MADTITTITNELARLRALRLDAGYLVCNARGCCATATQLIARDAYCPDHEEA